MIISTYHDKFCNILDTWTVFNAKTIIVIANRDIFTSLQSHTKIRINITHPYLVVQSVASFDDHTDSHYPHSACLCIHSLIKV